MAPTAPKIFGRTNIEPEKFGGFSKNDLENFCGNS
jgi:hypothetical protein